MTDSEHGLQESSEEVWLSFAEEVGCNDGVDGMTRKKKGKGGARKRKGEEEQDEEGDKYEGRGG
eukprot:762585-Hanusia_phi.AAC.2